MSEWLRGLNPEQQEAAAHTNGPLLILAGAGSGKTTVLVSRTGMLIENKVAKANQILVLTFTNKAARELKERVHKKLGDKAKGLWAGTFHSFGLSILRAHNKEAGLPKSFGVIDGSDSQSILRDLMKSIKVTTKESFDLGHLLNLINSLRADGDIPPDTLEEYAELARALKPRYEKRLQHLGVCDFEGLLLEPLRLFYKYPEILEKYQNMFHQVMVDEFQDTNDLQMELVHSLIEKHRNITVVGDDDQSIYGWRGANVRNILDFPKKYKPCHVVKLERNYRSSENIIGVANEIIKKNQDRHTKVLKAEINRANNHKPEVFIYDNEDVEVDEVVQNIRHFQKQGYKLSDIAILYRSNSQGGMLEGALRRQQIPYSLTGGSAFFERTEVKDVLAYIRCSLHPNEVAFRRILNTPSRGIGEATIENFEQYSQTQGISFIKSVQAWPKMDLQTKTGEGLDQLFSLLKRLPQALLNNSSTQPVGERLVSFFEQMGYRHYVFQQYKDPTTAEKKWQLIDILGRVLEGFVKKGGATEKTLREFLDSMELRDKVDEAADLEAQEKVQLLTLHASKGLEFPVVILMGVEEDILPHRSLGQDVNEERRLFYVGVTRAKERLVLTRARQRKRFGKMQMVTPSRFFVELSKELFTIYESGFRPVSETERKSLLQDFYKKVEQQKQTQS